MNAELVSELKVPRHRTARIRFITAMGPVTALAGAIWAIAQPYRLTILHPVGQGFWWLIVEPPLLVIVVGLFFYFAVVPGLLEDLEDARAASR